MGGGRGEAVTELPQTGRPSCGRTMNSAKMRWQGYAGFATSSSAQDCRLAAGTQVRSWARPFQLRQEVAMDAEMIESLMVPLNHQSRATKT